MPIHFEPSIRRTDAALVTEDRFESVLGSIGPRTVTFRGQTKLENLGKSLRNFFTLGMHSRLSVNPNAWRTFQASLLHDADEAGGVIDKLMIYKILSAYSHSEALTASKINTIMADFERAKIDPQWRESLSQSFPTGSTPLVANQNPVARVARSITQLTRRLTAEEQSLKAFALARRNEAEAQLRPPEVSVVVGDDDAESWNAYTAGPEIARMAEISSSQYAAQSMLNILRPGRPLNADDVNHFFSALQRQSMSVQSARLTSGNQRPFQFAYKQPNYSSQRMADVFSEALTGLKDFQGKLDPQSRGHVIYAVPLVLKGKGLLENHIVLVSVDTSKKQIHLLDSKGYPVEELESSYANAKNLKIELYGFGKQIFGEDWHPERDVVQLNIPKQRGANDCGPFVCEFGRRLLKGESIGEIERAVNVKVRADLRLNAAQMIKEGYFA
jgi:hypothetical protein